MYSYSGNNQEKKTQKNLIFAGILGLLPFLYYAILGYVDWTNITAMDYKIGAFFYDLRHPLLTKFIIYITDFGDKITIVAITFILLLFLFSLRKVQTGLWLGLSVAVGAGGVNTIIKEIYQRPRPDQIEHLVEQGGYSFPSGHSMGSIILYGSVLFLLLRIVKTKQLKWLLALMMGGLILSVGLSRIYLGVHYPSDIIAGFSLGFSWLCFTIAFYGQKAVRSEIKGSSNLYKL